jgi:hypothetical protein
MTVLQSVNPNIDIVFLLFVLHFTVIIGNVEVNPGPLTNEISNTSLVNTDIRTNKPIEIFYKAAIQTLVFNKST